MLLDVVEQIIAGFWNRSHKSVGGARNGGDLDFGHRVVDGQVTRRHFGLTHMARTTHCGIIGKTGTGKSTLILYAAQQDVASDRGFLYFDLHGDATPRLLKSINARERKERRHLSDKVVLIDPSDEIVSIGLNPLEQEAQPPDFVQIAQCADLIKRRCHLDHFGVRVEEALRSATYVLAANSLTLLEMVPLFTNPAFRAACLKRVVNPEIRQYFEERYGQASEGMQAVLREPVVSRLSSFTADPRFRHIVGQQKSSFSIREAMDEGHWVIVNLDKGRLGEHSLTLGGMILAVLKNALFSRKKRSLFTVYADELQNLVTYDSGVDTMLSEARKFGVSIVSANQFLEQYPPDIRAAILAVGSHAFFRLSPADASHIAQALDGGRGLAERLKNLPQRHCVVKSGTERWTEVRVPTVHVPDVDYTDLLNRCRYQRGRVRAHIERDIAKRQAEFLKKPQEVLDEWE